MKKSIENMVADTINQNPLKITIRGKEVEIPRPTLGTLIEVSKEIAELPDIKASKAENGDYIKPIWQTLLYARDCVRIPRIIAMLMLGKKAFYREIVFFGWRIRTKDRLSALARTLEGFTSEELSNILVAILQSLDCGFFLMLTTSLTGINQLKPTRT